MIPRGLEYSLFRQPLDVAGDVILGQRTGYFHLWRFEDAAGVLQLDGEVRVSFGTAGGDDFIPFAYNTRLQLTPPQDRTRIAWTAQPNRVAVILISADAQAVEAQNTPARQLVIGSGANTIGTGVVLIQGTLTQIRAANPARSRLVVKVRDTATGRVTIGPSGTALGSGLTLHPGESFIANASAELRGISNIVNTPVEWWEELSS
jgi:hypothetical protein